MPYTSEEIVSPFWADYSSEASGRDPLAIQNSSVVIYTKMIVGITNVTNRIRYNGFYCWIFDTILKNSNKKNSLQEQIRYSRRAELLLAFIMVKNFPDTTGVSGSAYAAKNIKPKINLKNGADWESKKEEGASLYWKFKLGVFGQYYSGVTRELNLINHPNPQVELNIYTLTEKGAELANAFEQNIPKPEGTLFWESVFSGSIREDDLSRLKSFTLHIIPEHSEERSFYQNALLAADDKKAEPSFNRRNTIKLLLAHLNTEKDGVENPVTSFLRANYKAHIEEQQLEADSATAWYLFEINELLHVAFEYFHFSFLYSIETYPTPLDSCILGLVKEGAKSFLKDGIEPEALSIKNLSISLSKSRKEVYTFYDAMEQSFKSREYGHCIMDAINTILCVYLNSRHQLGQLNEFAASPENNFNRTGYALEL
ncbi:MAG: hypothetical protein IT216_13320, partial [Saprospiraceae bacterium]|nr:hypothetical protein [Saprospiraceae bacterium]